MKILDKYLLFYIVKSSFLALFSLVLIFIFFQFIEELGEIDKRSYTLSKAIEYISFLIPSFFNSLVVLSILIGTVFSIGQLNSNKELQIYHTGSISQKDIIIKTLKYPFLLSTGLIIFLELITPQTLTFASQIKNQSLGKNSFQETNKAWFKKENEILFLNKDINDNYYFKLFNIESINLLDLTIGEEAYFSGNNLVAGDLKKIEFNNNESFFAPIESFPDNDINFNLDFDDVNSLNKDPKTMSFFELLKIAKPSFKNGNNGKEFITEILFRVIRPLTLVGMILVAIPFILNFQKNISIGKRIFLSIVIGIVTHLFTKIASAVSLKFDGIILVGPIIPTLILILTGVLLIKIRFKV